MRLTLRTLLAYLDDTLEPEQTKLIGVKVAESTVAQELVERIKKVTRRRSLASPPVHGDTSRLDPNSVAEYLDSTLSAEELSQVEQTCLEDDVYLAEVAACHQILTLMLSEPARVPPPARQRMYRLMKYPESLPHRRPPEYFPAPQPRKAAEENGHDRTNRLVTYLLGTLALALGLLLAVSLAWPRTQPTRSQTHDEVVQRAPVGFVVPPLKPADQDKTPAAPAAPVKSNDDKPSNDDKAKTPVPMPEPEPPAAVVEDTPKKAIDRVSIAEVAKERVEIGQLAAAGTLLVTQKAEGDAWLPVKSKGRVSTAERWMALPGFRTEVKFDSGVQVMLWGNLLEFMPFIPPLLECEVTAHVPATGLDADLSLDHGRLTIANVKTGTSARVRLRYRGEVWDLTLAEHSEVIIDGLVSHAPGARFTSDGGGDVPFYQLFLGVVKGNVSVTVRDLAPVKMAAPPGLAVLGWDNKGRMKEPVKISSPLVQWSLEIPNKNPANKYKAVLDKLYTRMTQPGATVELALTELAQDSDSFMQAYASYALPSIDVIAPVVDGMDNLLKPYMRAAGCISMYQWVARKPENALTLHKLLREKKDYTEMQADAMLQMTMLALGPAEIQAPATYEFLFAQLADEKLAIREFAYWHLAQLDPEGRKASMYDPTLTDTRDAAINRWRKRLTDGKIPPKPAKPSAGTSGR